MRCQYCKTVCIKYGKQKSGVQKYHCKSCGKTQQEDYSYKACMYETRKLIPKLKISNCGVMQIAEALEISPTTVISRVKKAASVLKAPALPYDGVYEVDEMKTYCKNKKNEIWVAYGIERKTGKVTAIGIGKRNISLLRKVINSILMSSPKRIYTDGLVHYKSLIPSGLHKSSKHFLNMIERKNLSVRNALKRFNRSTLGYSRSMEMLACCLKLFLWKSG